MMQFRKCCVLLMVVLTTGSFGQRKLFDEVIAKYASHQQWRYVVNYSIKPFDDDQPVLIHSGVALFRRPSDTLFGGTVEFDAYYDGVISEYLYDGSNVFSLNQQKKDVVKFPAGRKWAISGNYEGEVINLPFLRIHRLGELLDDPKNTVTYYDTIYFNSKCNVAKIIFPDEAPMKNMEMKFIVNKKKKTIVGKTFAVDLDDQHQWNKWDITMQSFDALPPDFVEKRVAKLTAEYGVTNYVQPSAEELKPLDINDAAPAFSGEIFGGGNFDLSSCKGKIVLIDFWYMACYGCDLAVPALAALQKKYEGKIVVVGANPVDSDEKRRKKLAEFIARKGINYHIVFVNSELLNRYKVNAFPTLYLIDTEGKIRSSEIGYSEEGMKSIDMQIEQLLRER